MLFHPARRKQYLADLDRRIAHAAAQTHLTDRLA
jgi:hypothetical protein